MSSIQERLKSRRAELGMTLAQIAEITGVREATVQRWESGAIKSIKYETIAVLADALHCTPSYLMGWEDSAIPAAKAKSGVLSLDAERLAMNYDKLDEDSKRTVWAVVESELKRRTGVTLIEEARRQTKRIPLLPNSFAAGPGEPDFGNEVSYIEVPDDSHADFAIKVTGDSMEPWLKDGSIAYGVKGAPDDGEVGAFLVDGEYKVKQCCVDAFGNLYLFSLNRARKDADDVILRSAERSVVCFGTILVDKLPGLPHDT